MMTSQKALQILRGNQGFDHFSVVRMLVPTAANTLSQETCKELARIIGRVPNYWELNGDEHKQEYTERVQEVNDSLAKLLGQDLSRLNPRLAEVAASWKAAIANSVNTIAVGSEQELGELLQKHGIDTSLLGHGRMNSIADLFQDVSNGFATFFLGDKKGTADSERVLWRHRNGAVGCL